MTYAQRIKDKLTSAFSPQSLTVEDESDRHAGHSGAHPDGETHFRIHIVSPAFDGQSRVARQRAVYKVLTKELEEHVHALAMTVQSPSEAD